MHLNSQISANPCICISARRAANALTNLYDVALARAGIKVTQYSLLKTINTYPDITINELSKKTKLNRTTLTRNLSVLEDDRYLVIIQDKEDLRKSIVRLTSPGEKVLKRAKALWEEVQKKTKKALGNDFLFYIELTQKLSNLSLTDDQ